MNKIKNRKSEQEKMFGPFLQHKKEIIIFSFCLILSFFAYSVLLSNELTNTFDGMWKGTKYIEYDWVISIGRWFWPMVGKLRRDLSPEPFASLFSLVFFTAGVCIIVFLFMKPKYWKSGAIILSMTINTCVCVFLSYRYMSLTFACAFFFGICGVYCLCQLNNYKIVSFVFSVMLFVFSLGLYQADFGCICILLLLFIVKELLNEKDNKKIFLLFLKFGSALILSCLIYKVIWDIVLQLFHYQANSYKGANNLSIKYMIIYLPRQIKLAYKTFADFFLTNSIKYNIFQDVRYFFICILLLFLILIFIIIVKRAIEISPLRLIPILILILLIPAAANVSMLIAVDSGEIKIQMTMPMVMVVPCLLALSEGITGPDDKTDPVLHTSCEFLLLFFLYGNFISVSIDQHIMLFSKNTTLSFMNRVMERIENYPEKKPAEGYIFIGRPVDNQIYRKDEVWEYSNNYARYGEFIMKGNCGTQSYYGLLRDCGFNIPFCWNDAVWHELEKSEEVISMPVFPEEGFIKKIGENIVVKISD